MRVVVVGATGNVGTSLLQLLEEDDDVRQIVGLARRPPRERPDTTSRPAPLESASQESAGRAKGSSKTTWVQADITRDDLTGHFLDADCVVHLAWLIQPSRQLQRLWRVNVEGSARVFEAVAEARVGSLVYASSVGAYSPGPKDRPVDEHWPTHGIPRSSYSREKAYVERMLDSFELANPDVRVVRLRPGLIFKREAASEIRRLFLGTLFPSALLRGGLIPVFPTVRGLRFQALHSMDVAAAYRESVKREVHGAFNVAADPVLSLDAVAEVLDARPLPVPGALLRDAAALSYHLRLHPVEPGWVDLALRAPLLDTTRVREELGWAPRYSAVEALEELFEGIRDGAGADTPALEPDARRSRAQELRTGQGAKLSTDPRVDG